MNNDISTLIAEVRAHDKAATSGPWRANKPMTHLHFGAALGGTP